MAFPKRTSLKQEYSQRTKSVKPGQISIYNKRFHIGVNVEKAGRKFTMQLPLLRYIQSEKYLRDKYFDIETVLVMLNAYKKKYLNEQDSYNYNQAQFLIGKISQIRDANKPPEPSKPKTERRK